MITSNREKARQAARRQSLARSQRARVAIRFEMGGGRCELCGQVVARWERAHLMGRGRSAKVNPAVAELAELSAALCRGCHRDIDGTGLVKRRLLQTRAVTRYAHSRRLILPDWTSEDPVGALRELLRSQAE